MTIVTGALLVLLCSAALTLGMLSLATFQRATTVGARAVTGAATLLLGLAATWSLAAIVVALLG